MVRKRGRPLKKPSSSAKKTPVKPTIVDEDHVRIDLSLSNEETLEDIDNLSPKKAEVLLRNLDTLLARITKKLPVEEKVDEGLEFHEEDTTGKNSQTKEDEKEPDVHRPDQGWNFKQLLMVRDLLLSGFRNDAWLHSPDGNYTIHSSYEFLLGPQVRFNLNREVWNSASVQKHYFIMWMAVQNRLRTMDRIGSVTSLIFNP
ncbi:hypothetical protein RIF29_10057 [Crotalaria pallida]|uniref:Reverse transcriptase zinc-binding domain-containing protein n=1 Tax=Crotalaria pallida TaxID=3830 RepID=A0AAN9II74_CROPI